MTGASFYGITGWTTLTESDSDTTTWAGFLGLGRPIADTEKETDKLYGPRFLAELGSSLTEDLFAISLDPTDGASLDYGAVDLAKAKATTIDEFYSIA